MSHLNADAVFSLSQDLVVREQATYDSELIKETYSQKGLILVSARTDGDRFRRTIEEWILDDEALHGLYGNASTKLKVLRGQHELALGSRQVPLNVSGAIDLESDLRNRSLVIPNEVSMAPYELSNDPLPLPAFLLYWPTVTPSFPPERPEIGAEWDGKLDLQVGAGTFSVSYKTKLLSYLESDPLVQVSLVPQPATAQVGEVTLLLQPEGSWQVITSQADGLWQSGEGKMTFGLRAKFLLDFEVPMDVGVLRWDNSFSIKRVPVTFDEETINAASWKPLAV